MKTVSYKEIRELTSEGIRFKDDTILKFSKCEQMKEWKGCIAFRDIIGSPPYFDFFHPSREEKLRIVFEDGNETEFHRLWAYIEGNGYHSFDLS